MLTLKKINKELAKHGIKEELVKGVDYFYFCDGDTADWDSTMVMVPRLNDLPMDQWLSEWECLSGQKIADIHE